MTVKMIAALSAAVLTAFVVWMYRRGIVGSLGAKIFAGLGAVLWIALLGVYDTKLARDHVGHSVSCSERFPFADRVIGGRHTADQQAEVLDYGLQNVRGLAYDAADKRLFLSEGDRSLLVGDWQADEKSKAVFFRLRYPDKNYMCPEERCSYADQGGLVIMEDRSYSAEDGRERITVRLYSAEHGRQRITVRNIGPNLGMEDVNSRLLYSSPLAADTHSVSHPVGVAAVDGDLFVTDDPSWPGPPATAPSQASPKPAASTPTETAGQSGAIYVCDATACTSVAGTLGHPSGVAAANINGPIFVAERSQEEIRWPIFAKPGKDWVQTGSLGSVPISNGTVPTFLGVALFDPCNGCSDDSRKMVFAAGPGGLYVFDIRGTLLGRVTFDEPVTGLALTGKEVYERKGDPNPVRYRLYLVVGHMLCSLTFRDPSENLAPSSNAPEAGVQPPEELIKPGANKPLSSPKSTPRNLDPSSPPKPPVLSQQPQSQPGGEPAKPKHATPQPPSSCRCELDKRVRPKPETSSESRRWELPVQDEYALAEKRPLRKQFHKVFLSVYSCGYMCLAARIRLPPPDASERTDGPEEWKWRVVI